MSLIKTAKDLCLLTALFLAGAATSALAQSPPETAPQPTTQTTATDDSAARRQFEILPWKDSAAAAEEAKAAAVDAKNAAAEAKAAAEAAKIMATPAHPAPAKATSQATPKPQTTAAIPEPEKKPVADGAKPDGEATKAEPDPPIPAKKFFGAATTGAPMTPRVFGGYAKGCLAGGVQLKTETDAWQAMRLSRNRNWGHPNLIALLERFATEMKTKENWPGLLIGDLAQPRGGPMLTGHKSHQLGLDADIWFKPMPKKVIPRAERETFEPLLLAEDNGTTVITKNWNEGFIRLVRRAANYPEVERIFVHPAIKREFCKVKDTDRSWLKKVRPMWLHNYHFHIRMSCPPGSPACEHQAAVTSADDGCGKEIDDWIKLVSAPPKPAPVPAPAPVKPKPKVELTLDKLPPQCRDVLLAGEPANKYPDLTAKTTPKDAKPKPASKSAAATKPNTKKASASP